MQHATTRDRHLWRHQLAALLARYPFQRDRLLEGLDPVERRAVEDIAAIGAMMPALPPIGHESDLLRVERYEAGGCRVYVGRSDGVYSFGITAAGGVLQLEPHGPWSTWREEPVQ
jgi:hypothetical protein